MIEPQYTVYRLNNASWFSLANKILNLLLENKLPMKANVVYIVVYYIIFYNAVFLHLLMRS